MKVRLTDVEVVIHHATERAWFMSSDGVRDHAVWIPKSVGEIDPGPSPGWHTVTIPEDVAIEKGLV